MTELKQLFHDFLMPILFYAHRKAVEEKNEDMQLLTEQAMRRLIRLVVDSE